ncbi:MAG: tetratricopeptide repeat protein [Proteobacteria bacterium]|nr:tetratricopeptide repeat protein [Pseudomonadota bacterium]
MRPLVPLPSFPAAAARAASLCAAAFLVAGLAIAPAAQAGFYEGLVAAQNEDWETALTEWLPIAEAGNPGAQSGLGDMYARGLGVEQNQAEAMRWHFLAARQGVGKSAFFIGLALAAGNGIAKDVVHGAAWLLIADRLGQLEAREAYSFVRVSLSAAQEAEARAIADGWEPAG